MTEASGWKVWNCPNCHKIEMFHRTARGWKCANCSILLSSIQDSLGPYQQSAKTTQDHD